MNALKYRILFFTLLGCLYLPLLHAQSYLVHTYNENDGLKNSTVYDIVQDNSGRMWFATRMGISCYDGMGWQSYSVLEGLGAPNYTKLRVDEEGTIWALPGSMDSPVSYFRANKWHALNLPGSYQSSSFMAFDVFSRNHRTILAAGTSKSGLLLYVNGFWRQISTANGLPSNYVTGVLKKDEQFFVATDKGLCIIRDSRVVDDYKNKINPPSWEIRGLAQEDLGSSFRLWLYGKTWVGFIQNDRFHLISQNFYAFYEKSYPIFALQPDYKGGVYFGNPYGIYHLFGESGRIESMGRKSGLIAEGATSFFMDREKNLWISSLRGVSKIPSLRFANYNKTSGLMEDEVSAIVECAPGKLVFGHTGGVTFFDGEKFNPVHFRPRVDMALSDSRVLDLAVDRNQNIWVAASAMGLGRMDVSGKIKWFRENSGLPGRTTSVLVDRLHNVYVSTEESLYVYDKGRFVDLDTGNHILRGVRKIFLGRDNSKFLATFRDGVYHWKKDNWLRYKNPGRLESNNIFSVFTDSQERIWVGSLAGLYVVKEERLEFFQSDDFDIKRPVYTIVEDHKGRIWFGTDNGVIRWDGQDAEHFTVFQGLVGQETNRSAGLVDTKDQVWIGTDLGASCYRQEFDYGYKNLPPPIIELRHVDASGVIYPLLNSNSFSSKNNTLIFHFYASSFIDENAISYRSRLLGFDKEWIPEYESHNRQIRYTNLPSGRYRFQIQGKNAFGKWSDIVTSSSIIIRKPLWKEWWFIGVICLLLGFISYSIQRFLAEKRYSIQLKNQVEERTLQLQDSEKRYRQMIENNKAVMLLVEPESGMIIDANPEACSFYGYSLVKMIGTNIADLCAESSLPCDKLDNFESLEEPSYTIKRHILASADIRDVEIYSCPIHVQERNYQFKIIHDISSRIEAEEKIKTSLKEKDVMLREIHHRVKNNMQIISSLLRLQSASIEDKNMREMFRLSQNRIKTMALIHDRLYRSEDLARIDFSEYVENLTSNLFSMYRSGLNSLRFEQKIYDIFLDINLAIPCGLIINELITNSLKHAFPNGKAGKISVKMVQGPKRKFCLIVKDTGVGFPEELDFEETETLGMQLVVDLVRQLNGNIELNKEKGTRFTITF